MILAENKGYAMALTLILSIGLDAELLTTRNLVLQSAGYTVIPAFSIKEAVDRFLGGDFDLVLLCQSIPTKEIDRLTGWIRSSGSRIPVVSVSGILCQADAFGDAIFVSDPNILLAAIREALKKAEHPPTSAAICRDKEEAPFAQGKKLPKATTNFELQTKTTKERSIPLAHAG